MSLPHKIQELLQQAEEENANRFRDVKPKTDIASPEKYMGLPEFPKSPNQS